MYAIVAISGYPGLLRKRDDHELEFGGLPLDDPAPHHRTFAPVFSWHMLPQQIEWSPYAVSLFNKARHTQGARGTPATEGDHATPQHTPRHAADSGFEGVDAGEAVLDEISNEDRLALQGYPDGADNDCVPGGRLIQLFYYPKPRGIWRPTLGGRMQGALWRRVEP
jgi:hypothetical protein